MLYLRCIPWELRRGGPRTVLAAAAVAVAVAAALVSLALREGARAELEAAAGGRGRDGFVVKAASMPPRPGRGGGWSQSTRLTLRDAELLRANLPGVLAVLPVTEAERRVALGGRGYVVPVRGVADGYPALRGLTLARGRFLDAADEAEAARVAVVGDGVARRLDGGRSLVGARILVGGLPFEVVGQLAPRGIGPSGGNEDDQVLVPAATALRRLLNRTHLDSLLVRMAPGGDMAAAQARALALLRRAHGTGAGARDQVELLAMVRDDAIRRRGRMLLEGLSGLFAAVTLGLGAAGIFAVTWLGVTQRTAEIGLRMAVGARRGQVALQVVLEAGTLGLLGGLAGLALGAGAVPLLRALTGWAMAPSWAHAGAALALSAGLGMLTGVVPALKAASTTPRKALRHAP